MEPADSNGGNDQQEEKFRAEFEALAALHKEWEAYFAMQQNSYLEKGFLDNPAKIRWSP